LIQPCLPPVGSRTPPLAVRRPYHALHHIPQMTGPVTTLTSTWLPPGYPWLPPGYQVVTSPFICRDMPSHRPWPPGVWQPAAASGSQQFPRYLGWQGSGRIGNSGQIRLAKSITYGGLAKLWGNSDQLRQAKATMRVYRNYWGSESRSGRPKHFKQ